MHCFLEKLTRRILDCPSSNRIVLAIDVLCSVFRILDQHDIHLGLGPPIDRHAESGAFEEARHFALPSAPHS